MSVKNMLPIIGVGSAAALIGLVASRRSASNGAANSTSRQRPSGITVRHGGSSDALEELPAPNGLPQGFWDAAPESTPYVDDRAPYADESVSSRLVREREESSDRDDLTAEWLARATQASSSLDDAAEGDADDPAEIPADSLSMISDASRYAAIPADEDDDDIVSER